MGCELQGSSLRLIHDILCLVNNATLIKSQSRLKEHASPFRNRDYHGFYLVHGTAILPALVVVWDKENMNEGYLQITP